MNPNLSSLVETCHAIFSRDEMNWLFLPELEKKLSSMRAEDFDVPRRMQEMQRTKGWECLDIQHADTFHISLILVPEGSELPLHDHPEMMVMTKALWGHLQYQSYDWAQAYPMSGLAHKHPERILDGSTPVQTLWPSTYNLHRIRALSPAAFVDVFSPWYNEDRVCRYYSETANHSNGLVHLECTS